MGSALRKVWLIFSLFFLLLVKGAAAAERLPPNAETYKTYYVDRCAEFLVMRSRGRYDREENKVRLGLISDVEMGEEIIVESPEQAVTRGLGPCLGIGVLNIRRGTAHLRHNMSGTYDWESFCQAALKEAESPVDLRVGLVGYVLDWSGRRDTDDTYGYDMPFRVIKFFEERGVKTEHIATAIGNRGYSDAVYSMRVSPDEKKIFVKFKPIRR